MSIRVMPKGDKWQVKNDGGDRATRLCDTQQEAIEIADQIARNQKTNYLIHRPNGQIRAGKNYSEDAKKPVTKKATPAKAGTSKTASAKSAGAKSASKPATKKPVAKKEATPKEVIAEETAVVETTPVVTTPKTKKELKAERTAAKKQSKLDKAQAKKDAKAAKRNK